MTYHVGRNGTQLGTFTVEQLNGGLASGQFQAGDLAWCEGMSDWKPIHEVLAQVAAPPPVPQVPVSAMPALPPKTSGLAVASLVLGIMTLFCSIFTGIPALITGIIALKRIGKSNGTLGGRGLAIGGLCCAAVLTIFGTAVLASAVAPLYFATSEKAKMMQASSNARIIIIALKNYASDNAGKYPDADKILDAQTSNDVFRQLITKGVVEDERIFTAANSPFVGDNNIGTAPDFKEALKARENHWAMTKGLTDSSNGNAPLIFENPTGGASWPPMWNCDVAGQPVEGRAWRGGKIIIGRNDGSVSAEQLESSHGDHVLLKTGADGKDLFTRLGDEGEILDVMR